MLRRSSAVAQCLTVSVEGCGFDSREELTLYMECRVKNILTI